MPKRHTVVQRIEKRTAKIAVVGGGYVGLPLAIAFAKAGFHVAVVDTDRERVEAIQRGRSYLETVKSSELKAVRIKLDAMVPPFGDPKPKDRFDAVVLCVPTPLDRNRQPDLRPLEFATLTARCLVNVTEALVVVTSTVAPGTTAGLVAKNLKPGSPHISTVPPPEDLHLAYSSERVSPGDDLAVSTEIPRVVGADGPDSLEAAVALMSVVAPDVFPLGSTRTAEASKLLENVYRCVNIALVNELKAPMEALGVDFRAAIAAAATKPFGFARFDPGPGVGGHCIPVDPIHLAAAANAVGHRLRFVELATEVNRAQPKAVVDAVARALNIVPLPVFGSRILLVGVAYKPNVGDLRESPALEVLEGLLELGSSVSVVDPHVATIPSRWYGVHVGTSEVIPALERDLVENADLVVVLTPHDSLDLGIVARHAKIVVDTRGAMRGRPCAGRVVTA